MLLYLVQLRTESPQNSKGNKTLKNKSSTENKLNRNVDLLPKSGYSKSTKEKKKFNQAKTATQSNKS
jgi:hypothetical protein